VGFSRQQVTLVGLGVAVTIGSGLGVRSFVAEPRTVISESMKPTLLIDDRVVVDKLTFRLRPPRVGEIVFFESGAVMAKTGLMVKRVIAVPGQRVEVRDGEVLVNDAPLVEPYVVDRPTYHWGPQVVPPEALFVLGDNRVGSADSHVWGFLPAGAVTGRAIYRVLPLVRVGSLH
jgi:signal peptidase I